jgi:hypothetical protein
VIFWGKVTAFSAIFIIFAPKFYEKMKKLIVLSAIALLFNIHAWAQEEATDSIGSMLDDLEELICFIRTGIRKAL